MKSVYCLSRRLRIALSSLAIAAFSITVTGQQYPSQPQSPSQPQPPTGQYPDRNQQQGNQGQVPSGEREAFLKIQSAATVPEKLLAATDFVKKYPKSKLRADVAKHVAAKIGETSDPAQRITHSESYLTVFKEDSESGFINPILFDSYIRADRPDDVFRVGEVMLAKDPGDVPVLTQLALYGTDQLKKGNAKFQAQTAQYGAKAIELIEGDKRGTLDAAQWPDYKTRWLGHLYQSMGIVSLVGHNTAEARTRFEKAAALNKDDAFNYALIGQLINDDYQQTAQKYKSMPAGPERDNALKQAYSLMDQMIDLYARSVALSEGNAAYQPLHDQVLQDLESYYKYRHDGSTAGLKELIDKYKKPSTGQ